MAALRDESRVYMMFNIILTFEGDDEDYNEDDKSSKALKV